MRASGRCVKCQHHEIVVLPQLQAASPSIYLERPAAVMAASDERGGSWRPAGLIEAYVCRRCGYTELYMQQADSLPVDRIEGARVLVGTPPVPYRS
jgi:predicted nucleic-acid-binding Zn-ribbon protein